MKLITQLNIRNPMLLTPEQEIAILRTLTEDDFLGNGSSRAVYSLDDNFVVKVAIAAPGVLQNETELNRFREEALIYKNREDRHLASIVAHGLCILIMEKVKSRFPETYCVEQTLSLLDNDSNPNFVPANATQYEESLAHYIQESLLKIGIHGKTRELVHKNRELLEDYLNKSHKLLRLAEYLQEYLDDIYGATSDNEQNGITADGYVVAYDYGYEPGGDNRDQVSHIGDMMDGGVDVLKQAIINIENDYVPSDDELDAQYDIYCIDIYDNYDEENYDECESNSAEDVKVYSIEGRIDRLIIDVYNQLASRSDKPVSIEEIVTTIDRWGENDGVDYWKELLGLDVRNWSPDNDRGFKDACNYVREFSYHTVEMNSVRVEYERYLDISSSKKDMGEENNQKQLVSWEL